MKITDYIKKETSDVHLKIIDMKKIIKSTKFDNCECNFKLKSKGPQAPE